MFVMPTAFFNVDIVLKLACHLDLSSALGLSQTCALFYHLSLSSKSYWIYATDTHRLPVLVSQIRDNYTPEQVRYMARVVSACGRNLRGDDFVALDVSRFRLRSDGVRRIASDDLSSPWGTSSAFIQGHTPGSLPWLVTIKGSILRCHCLDQKYDVGVEWDAESIIDWFWRCDIALSSVEGVSKESIVITFTTNDSAGSLVDVFLNAGIPARSTKLYIVEVSVPSREDIGLPLARETLKREHKKSILYSAYHKPPTSIDHYACSPKVKPVTCAPLPSGFVNDSCRPTSCGSKVYLVLKNKETNPATFWVFVYDRVENAGVRCQLPKDVGWRKVVGFPSMMLFQDWRGPVYGVTLPELSPLPQSPSLDPNSPTWLCHNKPLPLHEINFQDHLTGELWDPIDSATNANLLPLTGNIYQASESAFYLISRLGSRLCCCLYRCANTSSGLEFSRVAGGYVAIGDPSEDLLTNRYVSLRTGGTRSLVMSLKNGDESRKNISFTVIDFEIDCDYDGSQGVKRITGIKRELRVLRQTRSLLGKTTVPEVFDRENVGEVFFDGFRGTIGLMSKDCREAVLLKCTRD